MLNIKNNDIRLRRGDTTNLSLDITDINGVPYILPVFDKVKYLAATSGLAVSNTVYIIFNNQLSLTASDVISIMTDAPIVSAEYGDQANQIKFTVNLSREGTYNLKDSIITINGQDYLLINDTYFTIESLSAKKVDCSTDYDKLLPGQKIFNAFIGITIKDAPEGKVVYENFLDMNNSPAWYTKAADITEVVVDIDGYTKFDSQQIKQVTSLANALTYLTDNPDKVVEVIVDNVSQYCCLGVVESTKVVCNYKFSIGFQINAEDTLKLDLQNYVYDVCLYIGEQDYNETEKLPLKNIAYKQTLVPVSSIVMEDNLNG